jgi:ADP-heptose:LPS heptosyltransferase
VRILVIKLGALGDFVQAMGPAAAIRAHHPGAEITLLTASAFAVLGRACPYFDRVWIDERPALTRPLALLRLRTRLREAGFDRVYDLQTSDRSSFYFHLLRPGPLPEWSGIARGASHVHANPVRDRLHTLDRQADQLRAAGIARVGPPDLSWAATDLAGFRLPERFLLLVPGGAAHRPEKRWPAERYAELAAHAAASGLASVIVGGAAEAALGAAIAAAEPTALDLTGRTSFGDLVALGGRARHAVGNDTGPIHLIVAGGASATVLYSRASDPALTAPRAPRITILRCDDLAMLGVAEVAATLPVG